jgi:uncharacterized membrane protein YfcA
LTALLLAIGLLAGLLGSLLGLGGGVVVVPALEFLLPLAGRSLPIQAAAAISQIGVLSVSVASTAGYIQRGQVRLRLGYQLVLFTILGGILGSLLGLLLPAATVGLIFSLLLFYSAFTLLRGIRRLEQGSAKPSRWVGVAMTFAGAMSGLLGIGGGSVQVPVMNLLGGVPIREAMATSTFIMGLTAFANAVVYSSGHQLNLALAAPVALGILVAARVGAQIQHRIPVAWLKLAFSLILLYSGVNLAARSLGIPL